VNEGNRGDRTGGEKRQSPSRSKGGKKSMYTRTRTSKRQCPAPPIGVGRSAKGGNDDAVNEAGVKKVQGI